MAAFRKNIIVILIILLIIALASYFRSSDRKNIFNAQYKVELRGTTMGTVYSIKYLDKDKRNLKVQVDSVLQHFNQSLSTYIPDSEISRFNRQDTLIYQYSFFLPVLEKSKEIYLKTGGAFDPTVMPLVNAWGFGPNKRETMDSLKIDSLLNLIGFSKIEWTKEKVYKQISNIQLDFSAIAKGYGVDVIADYLKRQNIDNFLVEIGGEVVCRGKNELGVTWRLGIPNPLSTDNEEWLYAIIELEDKAMATSGNYLNYYETDGKIISHTISPFTGYPVRHEVLSATVIARDCMTADAYATAFMVLGLEKSRRILEADQNLEAYLVYLDENDSLTSYYTAGLKKILKEN